MTIFNRDQISTDEEMERDGAGITFNTIGEAISTFVAMNWERHITVAKPQIPSTQRQILFGKRSMIIFICF